MNHQHNSPQVSAGIFSMKLSDLISRVPERAQSVQGLGKSWVSSKASPLFLTNRRTRMEMTELNTETDTLSCKDRFFFPLQSHFTQTATKLNPMVGYGVPQSALELVAQPMWECAPPSLPPSSLPFSSLWTTPKQEVHFLFFLKKRAMLLQFCPQS